MSDTFFRGEFPILERTTYLNSCSLGALSRRGETYLQEFVERWNSLGASAWYELWMGRIEELRRRVAALHGCGPDEMALMPSTSVALSVVAESIRAASSGTERKRVVCTELDFPTLVYQWRVKSDCELVVLESSDGVRVDPQQFAAAVDERTLAVATSHVFFATGFVQDIDEIARIARRVGAYSIIDGYHGPGQIPIDVRAPGVDFYTSGPLKWLCGGPGLSYLYVRDELVPTLEPPITSWFAHARQFEFDIRDFEYRPDARRFEMGTPALPTIHTALGGQEIVDELGIERVAERNRHLTEYLIAAALDAGFDLSVANDPQRRSAIVMIRHDDPAGAVQHLARNDVIVDYRTGHVRVSPHFYNTEEEVERCVEVLRGYG